MNRKYFTITKLLAGACIFAMAFGTVGVPASHAVPGDEYKKMKGYVDFDAMGIFDNVEITVEVFLHGPLIKLCIEAIKHEEPEVAELLAGIKLVRVQQFELEDVAAKDVRDKTRKLAGKLEDKGWDIAVRVREKDEDVFIYLLPGKNDDIDGLVVMVIEDAEEATFVNIVGKIDPEQIGRIGRSIHIDGLDIPELEKNIKKNRKDREDRK